MKKTPQRTCIGCREVKDKTELIRIVRLSDASVCVDLTGKKPGRGAYICKNIECFTAAVKHKSFVRALDYNPTEEELSILEREITNG